MVLAGGLGRRSKPHKVSSNLGRERFLYNLGNRRPSWGGGVWHAKRAGVLRIFPWYK